MQYFCRSAFVRLAFNGPTDVMGRQLLVNSALNDTRHIRWLNTDT